MMLPAAATLAALFTTIASLGLLLRYDGARAYVAFGLLAGSVGAAAWRVTCTAGPDQDDVDRAARAGVAAFALVVLCALALGAIRRISVAGFFVVEAVGVAAIWVAVRPAAADRREPDGAAPLASIPPHVVGLAGALVAFIVGFAATHAPLTLYDSVSYHLHFAARWLQDGAISIIPTPFSDEAQAYAPGNGELFFMWLMTPFHGDLLARLGQLPFALLIALLLWTLARRLGAAPSHAAYPALFFLLARPVLEQAVGANVDLICAAMFLASIFFGVVAVERDRAVDWLWWGVSVGLYGGTKYLALVYAPVLLLAAARRPSARMLWALPGIALFAAPWYLRNWIVAGSPIYPASVQVGGLTIARGAFTRAAMLNTIFHTRDWHLVPTIAAHAFGPTLFVFWVPFAIVGAWRMASRGWWPGGLLAALPLLMAPLFWLGLPVNVDSRFFLPAIAPAMLPLAFVFSRGTSLSGSRSASLSGERWNTAVHAAYAAAAVWMLAGVRASLPLRTPWFMDGWLALNGLVPQPFLPALAALTVIVAAAWWLGSRRSLRWAVPFAAIIVGASSTALAYGSEQWCRPSRCDYLDTTSPYIRGSLLYGWRWVADNIHGTTIAYTGINLPYPLTGERLSNRVVYANIDGRLRWRFHDYDRAFRSGRFEPRPPLLAASSGELMPVAARSGPRDDALRPRYERMDGLRDAWVANLDALGVRDLFVAALSAYEIDYVSHNARGFPIEDDWAAADPARFRLVYENVQVRIYAVDPPPAARTAGL